MNHFFVKPQALKHRDTNDRIWWKSKSWLETEIQIGKLELDNGIPTLSASIYSETCLIQTLFGTRLCVQNRQVYDIYRVN